MIASRIGVAIGIDVVTAILLSCASSGFGLSILCQEGRIPTYVDTDFAE
jgi:hypothetical protein